MNKGVQGTLVVAWGSDTEKRKQLINVIKPVTILDSWG